jgi:phosphopantothenoylcysteine synthetase/decarboxylase
MSVFGTSLSRHHSIIVFRALFLVLSFPLLSSTFLRYSNCLSSHWCWQLRRWADVFVIISGANTLAKLALGLCDNLVTCIVRAWDVRKPLLVAPAMNTLMYEHPLTEEHLALLSRRGVSVIPCIEKKLACGDVGKGALAEVPTIVAAVLDHWQRHAATATAADAGASATAATDANAAPMAS